MTDTLLAWLKAHPVETLALTLYGEARGEPIEGRIGVGCVVLNRVKREYRGTTVPDVCLWPFQFSCWAPVGGVANYTYLVRIAEAIMAGREPTWMSDRQAEVYAETLWLADGLVRGVVRDRVAGARHYLTRVLYESKPPAWAQDAPVVCEIGSHVFVRAK